MYVVKLADMYDPYNLDIYLCNSESDAQELILSLTEEEFWLSYIYTPEDERKELIEHFDEVKTEINNMWTYVRLEVY